MMMILLSDIEFDSSGYSPVELYMHIKLNGMYNAIDVEKLPNGKYKILNGVKRCKVARELNWRQIAAIIHELINISDIFQGEMLKSEQQEAVDLLKKDTPTGKDQMEYPIEVMPITRKPGFKYIVVSGYHRLKACEQLGWSKIWAKIL